MIESRKLGSIGVSPVGMGCMAFSHGYGQIPEESYSIDAIRAARDFGCTFFDTAESYGKVLYYEGHNEEIVGKAVKPFRKDVVLATKLHFTDMVPTDEAETMDCVRGHLQRSLRRLGTDYVDLYYLHRVHLDVPVEWVAAAMGKLIDEGLIRGWGMSQVDVDTIDRAQRVTPLSAIQNIYNMLERGIEATVIPYCLEHGIGVVPFSPVASGFLSGKVSASTDFSHADDVRKFVPQLSAENIDANRPVLDLLERYAVEKQATKAQIAIAWMLAKYPNVVPIPGSKNRERILENLGSWNVALSEGELKALDSALDSIPIHGHRGYVQFEGGKMSDWGKK